MTAKLDQNLGIFDLKLLEILNSTTVAKFAEICEKTVEMDI